MSVRPWNLRNIHEALYFDTEGNVTMRTGFSGNNVSITGNVTLPANLVIESGNVSVTQGTSPWIINGVVTVNTITSNVNVNPITGTVTIDSLPEVEIKNDSGNPIPVTGNVNVAVTSGNVGITGSANVNFAATNLDAFGRLRVSNPVTLFDSQNLHIDGDQFSNITANSGTVTYVAAESSHDLFVTTANGSSVIRQAKAATAYQPGKSLLTLETFAMSTLQANLRQRVGYFTERNGIYFEANGTDLFLVIRSSASGTVTEERIAQADWNTDTLDGSSDANNPSGININPALVQIFWKDIEWLGVGTVRAGFVIDGQFIVCHKFHHANQSGNTTVYMTTATGNPRYEITNTGTTAANSTMKQICSTVISEGGYTPATKVGYVTNGTTTTRISSGNVVTSLASIRINPAFPDTVVIPAQVDLLLLDVRYGEFRLIENATFTTTWSNVAGSTVQGSTHANTITDGTVVYAGLTSSRDEVEIGEAIKKRLQLKRHANGTPITFTLAVAYTQGNADLLWKLGWEELTN